MVQMRKDFNLTEILSLIDKKANIEDTYTKFDEHQVMIHATKDSFNMFTDDFTACLVEFNQMKKRIDKL